MVIIWKKYLLDITSKGIWENGKRVKKIEEWLIFVCFNFINKIYFKLKIKKKFKKVMTNIFYIYIKIYK